MLLQRKVEMNIAAGYSKWQKGYQLVYTQNDLPLVPIFETGTFNPKVRFSFPGLCTKQDGTVGGCEGN